MKVTIYELLGLVKDGKAPKEIEFKSIRYEWIDDVYVRFDGDEEHYLDMDFGLAHFLNDTVEILEEKPTQEEIKEYTNKFLEVWIPVKKQFGKLFDEIARIGNNLDLEDELEEQKKIPEKIDIRKMLQTKKWKRDKKTWETINSIIDYLKSKGE